MGFYRVWDGKLVERVAWLSEAEAVELRRQGFYVVLISV